MTKGGEELQMATVNVELPDDVNQFVSERERLRGRAAERSPDEQPE
jgi:hypothetical protein